jgi:hypothetical protein
MQMAGEPVAPTDLADDVTKWNGLLTLVLGTVTTIGGGAATLSGGAERMFREQPLLALGAALAAFSGFAFLALGAVLGRNKGQRSRSIANSIICFVGALALGTVAVLNTSGSADQPGITGVITTTGGQPTLELTVTASGVRSDERMNVLVSGVSAANERDPRPLLATVVGANRDGLLSATFSVNLGGQTYATVAVAAWAVMPRPFFCDSARKGEWLFESFCSVTREPNCNVVAYGESDRAACLLLTVSGATRRPSIDLALTRVDDSLTLTGSIAALPERGHAVYLFIYPSGSDLALYSTKLVPELDGSINADLAVGLDPALDGICVVAVEAPSVDLVRPRCPVTPKSRRGERAVWTTWLALTAPPKAPDVTESPPVEPEVTPEP